MPRRPSTQLRGDQHRGTCTESAPRCSCLLLSLRNQLLAPTWRSARRKGGPSKKARFSVRHSSHGCIAALVTTKNAICKKNPTAKWAMVIRSAYPFAGLYHPFEGSTIHRIVDLARMVQTH